MRHCAALLVVMACRIVHTEDLDRVVDAPITLDEVRARAKPPDVVVEIRTEKVHYEPSAGGGACHAGPVCVLALLLPKDDKPRDVEFQIATIRDHGRLMYEASFEAQAFRGGWLRDDKRARLIDKIYAAGRPRLVEVGSAPVNPDGTLGEVTRSPILPQIDLAKLYLAQLIEDQKHHKHEEGGVGEAWAKNEAKALRTIGEMANVLTPDEAAGLGRAWQNEPRLNAKVKEHLRVRLAL